MATYQWIAPSAEAITGQTKIKDADNKIANTIANLVQWVNSTDSWSGGGLQTSMEEEVANYLSNTATVEW